jgi:peptidoglycan/LPS O-acetylase OafA/YrhL
MRLASIQLLRAIGAYMIVLFHTFSAVLPHGGDLRTVMWLRSGVDIFFVISGVVMWLSTSGTQIGPLAFYAARLKRIVPLYWLVTTLMLVVFLVAPTFVRSFRFDAAHLIASYLFFAWPSPVPGLEHQIFPVVIVGWSLNSEVFFYLLFGVFLLVPVSVRGISCTCLFLLIGVSGYIIFVHSDILDFYLNYTAAEFGLGVALGMLYVRGWPLRSGWISGLFTLIGFILLPIAFLTFDFGAAMDWTILVGSVLIVAGGIGLETSGAIGTTVLGNTLGNASYALYLTHPIVVSAVAQFGKKLGLADTFIGSAVIALMAIGAAIATGLFVHRYIEQPIARFLSGRQRPNQRLAVS